MKLLDITKSIVNHYDAMKVLQQLVEASDQRHIDKHWVTFILYLIQNIVGF